MDALTPLLQSSWDFLLGVGMSPEVARLASVIIVALVGFFILGVLVGIVQLLLRLFLSLFPGWSYRQEVLGSLYAIMFLYPTGAKNILKQYPGVRDAIKMNWKNGTPAKVAAVDIAATICNASLSLISVEEREKILAHFKTMKLESFRVMLRDSLKKGRHDFPPGLSYGGIMTGLAILMVSDMQADGEIEQADADRFGSEVIGFLAGKNAEERFRERIDLVLDETFG